MTCDGSETEKKTTIRERRRLINNGKRIKKAEGKVPSEELVQDDLKFVETPIIVKKKKKKRKSFKIPSQLKRLCKRADKKDDSVVAQYLTSKGLIKFKLCKIISGNIIVVNNKVHILDPQCLWRHKKHFWYIVREIDRRPVSNKDYSDVKKAGMDTDADTPLIKAVLGAIKKNKKEIGDKKFLIIGAVGLAVIGVIYYMFTRGAA